MTVHLGRWQDTIPGTYDPETSVVITDPPFGIGRLAYSDSISWSDHVREVLEKLPASRHVIRGPSSLICRMDVPPPRRMVIEAATFRLGGGMPGAIPHRWHGWLVWGNVKVGRGRPLHGDWFTVNPYDATMKTSPGGVIHDAATPFGACYRIVSMWAEQGYTVIDPFMGLGTIGQAAQMIGNPYIGSETDIRWHNKAIDALRHVQSEMFA